MRLLSMTLGLLVMATPIMALHVAHAQTQSLPPGIHMRNSPDGVVFADAQDRVLFHLDQDRRRRRFGGAGPWARCADDCKKLWVPVAVPAGFTPTGAWGITTQGREATPQLSYKNDPLYVFTGNDIAAAADLAIWPPYMSGYSSKVVGMRNGVPTNALYWHPALYDLPAPATTLPSGIGSIWDKTAYFFTDARQHKLYAPTASRECANSCGGMMPLAAPLAALAVGNWQPVEDKDQQRVWSYRGRVVYQPKDDAFAANADLQALEVQ